MIANAHDDGPASSGLAAVDPLYAGIAAANSPAGGGCGCGCGGSCGCSRATADAANAVDEPSEDAGPAARLAPATVSARAAMTRSTPSQRRQRPAPDRAGELRPSSCADGNCGTSPRLVYALGELGYDFGSQARHDAIDNELDEGKFAHNPDDLLEFLQRPANRHYAASLIWTLHDDETPLYAIRPEGAYARDVYDVLLEFFADQRQDKAERVSIPGVLDGGVRLQSGQTVPVVVPDLRGMFNWKTAELAKAMQAESAGKASEAVDAQLENFLERVYYDVRNLGQQPGERALNFAATRAFLLERVFQDAVVASMQLDEIGVEPSPICRPESDCWDVKLIFFTPSDIHGTARKVFRFTVDVSDIVPVLVGTVRTWSVR